MRPVHAIPYSGVVREKNALGSARRPSGVDDEGAVIPQNLQRGVLGSPLIEDLLNASGVLGGASLRAYVGCHALEVSTQTFDLLLEVLRKDHDRSVGVIHDPGHLRPCKACMNGHDNAPRLQHPEKGDKLLVGIEGKDRYLVPFSETEPQQSVGKSVAQHFEWPIG